MKVNKFKNKFLDRTRKLGEYLVDVNDYQVYFYLLDLQDQFSQLLSQITNKNFWDYLPKILAIDSKFALLEDLLKLDLEVRIKGQELIELVEKDYLTYNKENCGYKINEDCSNSMIFYIE